MTPAGISDTTTACGSSGEDSVQAAQRGQVKVQIIKRPAANIFFGFPSRAAKQGRGNESVSGGDREPRLTEPQRDSCRRSRRMRCSAAARLCRQMLHFASLTEILSLRYRLSVFLSRRKKNSEKERPLRGLRREVRFIMSPPGKRRHNELNAAPPPENPRRTGKTGETNNRDNVHSGESFCIRGKKMFVREPRGTTLTLASP